MIPKFETALEKELYEALIETRKVLIEKLGYDAFPNAKTIKRIDAALAKAGRE
jgi:hypothetical protein